MAGLQPCQQQWRREGSVTWQPAWQRNGLDAVACGASLYSGVCVATAYRNVYQGGAGMWRSGVANAA